MARSVDFHVGASPVESVAEASRRYSESAGLHMPGSEGFGHVVMSDSASRAIGHAYDRLPEFDKSAIPAYRQMAHETAKQFEFMTRPKSRGGMGIDVEVTKHDPYGQDGVHNIVSEIRNDINNHNRIKVFATASTGGHPVFSNDENDMFRAVHDVFGHLGSGRGIDKHGEEAAYQKHSQMFSPLARQAMATETRGQNSALHLHGEFQDQKVAILPQAMQSRQFSRAGAVQDLVRAVHEARQQNLRQGL